MSTILDTPVTTSTTPALDPDWVERAGCQGMDVDIFYSHEDKHGRVRNNPDARFAKRVCGLCPVRLECLITALRDDEKYGIWGGLDHAERSALVRRGRESREGSR